MQDVGSGVHQLLLARITQPGKIPDLPALVRAKAKELGLSPSWVVSSTSCVDTLFRQGVPLRPREPSGETPSRPGWTAMHVFTYSLDPGEANPNALPRPDRLFPGLWPAVALVARRVRFERGALLIAAGEPVPDVLLLHSGWAAVAVPDRGSGRRLAELR